MVLVFGLTVLSLPFVSICLPGIAALPTQDSTTHLLCVTPHSRYTIIVFHTCIACQGCWQQCGMSGQCHSGMTAMTMTMTAMATLMQWLCEMDTCTVVSKLLCHSALWRYVLFFHFVYWLLAQVFCMYTHTVQLPAHLHAFIQHDFILPACMYFYIYFHQLIIAKANDHNHTLTPWTLTATTASIVDSEITAWVASAMTVMRHDGDSKEAQCHSGMTAMTAMMTLAAINACLDREWELDDQDLPTIAQNLHECYGHATVWYTRDMNEVSQLSSSFFWWTCHTFCTWHESMANPCKGEWLVPCDDSVLIEILMFSPVVKRTLSLVSCAKQLISSTWLNPWKYCLPSNEIHYWAWSTSKLTVSNRLAKYVQAWWVFIPAEGLP